jgi:hypothetical protein
MAPRLQGMSGHHSRISLKDEWLTPPSIIEALGPFDIDPCAPLTSERPWPTATEHYTIEDDGLDPALPWIGRVWLNPPYGDATGDWLRRLADHGNGIALIFARTETEAFFETVWERADALVFLRGRLHFHHLNGDRAEQNAGAPSVLVAYGYPNALRLWTAVDTGVLPGRFVQLRDFGGRVSG